MAQKQSGKGATKKRKTKYETHVKPKLKLIEAWARDGDIDETIAKKLGVAYSTFRAYKDKYEALSAALKRGKEVVDVEVENALLKRALGYEYTEEKVEVETTKTGAVKSRKVVQIVKQVAPDVGAACFWLKNRKPNKWRDRQIDSQDENMLKKLDDVLGKIEGNV